MLEPDPQPTPPKDSDANKNEKNKESNKGEFRIGLIKVLVPSMISAVIVVALMALLGDRIGIRRPLSNLAMPEQPSKPPAPPPLEQTEAMFLKRFDSKPASTDEWWAARSDHRLIAYAVLHCKKLSNPNIDTMPRQTFSSLLLDLTPSGNHVFETKAGDDVVLAARDKDAHPTALTSVDHEFLALSDSIARARLFAAEGASSNVPWVQRLGLATLIVTALATLFVTLQGRMKQSQEEGPRRGAKFFNRVHYSLFGDGSGYRWVAFFAIALSIAGTSLTGMKQVYDPTRTLTQNTRALLDLRQLHQEVIHGIRCQEGGIAGSPMMPQWAGAIRRIRGLIIPAYGGYVNFDAGPSRPTESGQQTSPPAQPPVAPGQTVSAAN